jgi:hypothetical protein
VEPGSRSFSFSSAGGSRQQEGPTTGDASRPFCFGLLAAESSTYLPSPRALAGEDTRASGFVRFVSSFGWPRIAFPRHHCRNFCLVTVRRTSLIRSDLLCIWRHLVQGLYYRLNGAFLFTCFMASCFRRSRCPKPLIVALIYNYLVTGGSVVGTATQIIMVVLCTLNGPEPRRGRIDEPGVTGSIAG